MYKIGLMGGADEIGRSMIYIEYNKKAIVVDCGMEFPADLSSFGVNKIVSYGSYIKNNLKKVSGLFITHLHEDHIGGVRRFLEKFNVPIYAEPLTCEFLKMKHSFKNSVRLIPIQNNEKISIGGMTIRPFEVEHSTIKAFGYEIFSKFGNIVLTGDFKLGNSKADAIQNLEKWGLTKKPLALIMESTNSNSEGFSTHESDILPNIERVIKEHSDEVFIISTFASSMQRLKNIIEIAQRNQRNIFLMGRNMEVAAKFLIKNGIITKSYLNFINEDKCNVPDNALILSTGCQGEPQGGLYKLIKKLKHKDNKTVLFSSSVIPGNELSINSLKIALLKAGFKYIEADKIYHTSGHARKEEHICLIDYLEPKFVIPVHGDYIKQLANKANAISCGVLEENIILTENNSIIRLKSDGYDISEIHDSLEYITTNGLVKPSVIEAKKSIAKNGIFIYSISGRYIKFSSVGIPDNCKLNRLGRTFVQTFLQVFEGGFIDKVTFKEACREYLSKELKNESNIPFIEVVLLDNKFKTPKRIFVKKDL